jgi:hypothetical protein
MLYGILISTAQNFYMAFISIYRFIIDEIYMLTTSEDGF